MSIFSDKCNPSFGHCANNNPVAVFDSGLGGLSVLTQIVKYLPFESVYYLADSQNCPYGSRSADETIFLAKKHIDFLIRLNCKMVVIACNTITATAIDILRKEYSIPFIGMEPALKPAALNTRTGKIGILATENTFKGKLYQQTFEKFATQIDVFVQPGFGLVELVESNQHKSREADVLIEKYLAPMIDHGVDTIVLGCTHYPFFMESIRKLTGDRINVINPAMAVAAHARRILDTYSLLSDPLHVPDYVFYTSGSIPIAKTILSEVMDCRFDFVSLSGPSTAGIKTRLTQSEPLQ